MNFIILVDRQLKINNSETTCSNFDLNALEKLSLYHHSFSGKQKCKKSILKYGITVSIYKNFKTQD